MIANNWGRIINIASAHGLVASPFKSAYVAAKHGMLGLTKVTALEDRGAGHHLQRDLPRLCLHAAGRGADRRPGQGAGIPREQVIREVLLAQQPNKRFATVEELGAFAVFLASDAAASITGTSLAGRWRLDRALKVRIAQEETDGERTWPPPRPYPAAKPPTRSATSITARSVLVLQGGGALGAYQGGVYQALHEAGIEPDWMIGTSIGAINAS